MRTREEYRWYDQLGREQQMAGHTFTQVAPPTRSRLWTTEDADAVFALLTAPDNGNQAVQYGEYGEKEEQKARTQGMALNRLIEQRHQRRFGISVWEDGGKFIGALLPRAPKENKKGKPAAKK